MIKVIICVFLGDSSAFHDFQSSRPKTLNLSREKFVGVKNFKVVQQYLSGTTFISILVFNCMQTAVYRFWEFGVAYLNVYSGLSTCVMVLISNDCCMELFHRLIFQRYGRRVNKNLQ